MTGLILSKFMRCWEEDQLDKRSKKTRHGEDGYNVQRRCDLYLEESIQFR